MPCCRGLAGLVAQTRLPDDVILVVRPSDLATHEAMAARVPDGLPWRIVPVHEPGLVAARNAGLAAQHCDVVAFCDDDTVASPEWLARILPHFDDPAVGGVGGRDRCHDGTGFDDRQRQVVGHLQWWGRAIGNHHLGFGAARRVDFLKGANMSYRAEAVRGRWFDTRLRGKGAQADDDLSFSLSVATCRVGPYLRSCGTGAIIMRQAISCGLTWCSLACPIPSATRRHVSIMR